MPKPAPLGFAFEALEARTVPTIFGVPWADPEHLTLSFVPDGTPTPLGPSSLSRTLAAAGSTAAWEHEVVRAFQTWAANSNINIGIVADGGQALGSVGAVQGDSRFGDIRIAAAPMSPDSVANASPFSWTGTTLSGDVVLNANDHFTIGNTSSGYDIFSVMVHEAGHVLGMDHSTVAGSVMNETYAYHTGLGGDDVTRLQALYGAPRPNPSDTATGNTTRATAAAMPSTSSAELLVSGDLIAPTQTDYYKFSAPLLTSGLSGVTVRLKAAGMSLLTGSVTVYNSAGWTVATTSTTDPLNNDLIVSFSPGLFGGNYTVKVQGTNNGAFSVGSYKLAVDFLSLGSVLAPITTTVAAIADGGLHSTLATALGVQTNSGGDARFDAIYRGVLENAGDVDAYRIRTDKYAAGTAVTLNVMVWGLDANPVDARVRVFDAAGNPVAFQVLANDTGLFSVQVLNAAAGANYYVKVSARDGAAQSTGSYFFAADFNRIAPLAFNGVGGGTVPTGGSDAATLALGEAGLFQFALAANGQQAGTAVTMTVYDANGNVVFTLTAVAGEPPVTTTRFLQAGTYTVAYSGSRANTGPVGYDLFMLQLSDPVGPYGSNVASPPSSTAPSSPPPPPPPSSTPPPGSSYTYSGSSTTRPSGYYYTY